jgi:hypothetical protein
VKNNAEGWRRARIAQLRGDDLVQAAVTVEVQIRRTALQVHGKDQAHQTQVMIAVQVTDKDVIDAVVRCAKTHELHLRGFTTVD